MGSAFDWFDEFEYNARLSGDHQRALLGQLHREAYRYRETDPDRALGLVAEGRRLAESLREPWWVLYYDQQRVHALLHFKQDFRDVLDLAVRNTLEARKTGYANFPRRLLIHLDLVSAYLGIDPAGHADAVTQAMEYLEKEVEPISDERYLLLGSQRQFLLDLDRTDEALELGRQSLALSSEDPEESRSRHFLVFTYSGLAEIAFRLGDDEALLEAALAGEETARRVGHQVELAGFQLWQALAARRAGREDFATPLYRQAVARLNRLGMPPDASYRDAECAFHVAAGDIDWAVQVRDSELAEIEGHGRLRYETAILTKRCELLAKMGPVGADDLQRAREAAGRLKLPEVWLERLGRLEG
jgi:hypothetical protein